MSDTENYRAFLEAYKPILKAAIIKNPDQYFKAAAAIDSNMLDHYVQTLAERMTAALRDKSAALSSPIKATARALGISPTMKGIQEFLRE